MFQMDLEEERRQHLMELESIKNETKRMEASLLEKLDTERRILLEERSRVEFSLRQEMEVKLVEKDRAMEEPLLRERERLNLILKEKDKERQQMECLFNEERLKNDLLKNDELSRIKDVILSDMADVIETELQCSICSELFVQVGHQYRFFFVL